MDISRSVVTGTERAVSDHRPVSIWVDMPLGGAIGKSDIPLRLSSASPRPDQRGFNQGNNRLSWVSHLLHFFPAVMWPFDGLFAP